MPKVIQNNNQILSNNINRNSKSSSNSSVLSSVFARLVSLLSSFILVLRHGLKKIKEFLGLFPYLRTLFPWRSSTFIKRNRQIRIVAFISCFAFVLLSFTILHPLSSPTQPTEAATGSSQSSSLTLDLASSSASVDLLVTDPEGSFAVSSSNAEFNVTTNNFTGYTLSIMSSNDEGLLTSTNGSSLSSITSAISLDTFAGSTSYNGKWGYRPSVYNAAANTSFLPSPTTTATTLDTTTAPNTSTPNYYTIEIGVRSDYTTASSSYTNTFIITAVSNPINYTISYNSHTSDNVTNMPSTQSSSTSATSIVLADNVPVRDGYDFMGWCTVAPDTTTPETCTGTTFQPGGDFGIDQTTLNNTTLYAMWKSTAPTTMQNVSLEQCQQFASNNNYSLTDSRDSNNYTIRYINGLCWMTQNLNYDPITYATLTPETSDVSSTKTLSATDTSPFSSSYYGSVNVRSSSENGYYYNYCAATAGEICSSSNTNEATQSACPAGWRLPTLSEQGTLIGYHSEFTPTTGGYYNNSAISGTSYGYYWSSTTYTNASYRYSLRFYNNVLSSSSMYKYRGAYVRCIKDYTPGSVTIIFDGNGSTGGNVKNQTIAANTSASLTPNEFIKTDGNGYYFFGWNTEPDGSGINYADGANYEVAPTSENYTVTLYAQWGLNLLDDVTYMQDLTEAHCEGSATGVAASLIDRRDGNTYNIKKIGSNCWMTKNLNYDPVTNPTLDPSASDVSTSTTLSASTTTDFSSSFYNVVNVRSSDENGYYYNYCAATAGEICDSSNTNEATQSVCPAGWRLPTYAEYTTLKGKVDEFMPTKGYYSGSSFYTSYGRYWSSTANTKVPISSDRWALYYYTSSSSITLSTTQTYGYYGNYVRCIRDYTPGTVTITFNGNGNTGGTMSDQIITAGTSAELKANTFTKTGDDYIVVEWNTEPDGSGVSYEPEQLYIAPPSTENSSVTLYAQWKANLLNNVTYLQDITTAHCTDSHENATATLRDNRDNNTYTVAKYRGVCWMTQNLRIAKGKTLTPANSNVASNWTIPYDDLTSGDSATQARSHVGNTTTGNWYNFCAASAGTLCVEGTSYKEAEYDICPKGWRLPKYAEYDTLIGYPSEDELKIFPIIFGGYYEGGTLKASTNRGWWSTNHNYVVLYSIPPDTNSPPHISSSSSANGMQGRYIRCVVK